MERTFLIISRLNSVLFLLLLLGAGIGLASMTFAGHAWQQRGAIDVVNTTAPSKKPVHLQLERVENIAGSDAQMIQLSTRDESSVPSSGYAQRTRNVLFLGGAEKQARWLFKTHRNLILSGEQLRLDRPDADEPARALYFEYVAQDSDGDGTLTEADRSSVALTRPDGSGFTEVLTGLNRVLAHQLKDAQHLSVVYQRGAVVRHARISLATMKVDSDQEVVTLPETL
jgi:hypothetical protein